MFGKKKLSGEKIGNVDPICPYCGHRFDEKPGRKKKCPKCGNFIFVRTRPADREKVLVTGDQAERIEEEWSVVNGTHEAYLARKQRFQEARAFLAKMWGKEPTDNDITYHLLNEDAMELAKLAQWGLYRNAKLKMAEILRKEERVKDALAGLFEVCYLDLNGPSNAGTFVHEDGTRTVIVDKFNVPWDPNRWGNLAPGVVGKARRLLKKVGADAETTRELFIHGAKAAEGLRLPISPEKAWRTLHEELFATKTTGSLG